MFGKNTNENSKPRPNAYTEASVILTQVRHKTKILSNGWTKRGKSTGKNSVSIRLVLTGITCGSILRKLSRTLSISNMRTWSDRTRIAKLLSALRVKIVRYNFVFTSLSLYCIQGTKIRFNDSLHSQSNILQSVQACYYPQKQMKPPNLCQNMNRFLKFSFEICELRGVRNEIPEASELL